MNKGKCYDKLKRFKEATLSYEKALKAMNSSQANNNKEVRGNLEFRLGWAFVRSRENLP